MREHLEYATLNALMIEGKNAERHQTHMGYRGIGDQFLDVLLRQRNKRCVDDRNERQAAL